MLSDTICYYEYNYILSEANLSTLDAPKVMWPIWSIFNLLARWSKYDVKDLIRFNTVVRQVTFDDVTNKFTVVSEKVTFDELYEIPYTVGGVTDPEWYHAAFLAFPQKVIIVCSVHIWSSSASSCDRAPTWSQSRMSL